MNVFIDIETIANPAYRKDEEMMKAFERRYTHLLQDKTTEEKWDQIAALYPEFGQIVCISIVQDKDGLIPLGKTFAGINEADILNQFCTFIGDRAITWIGHNIKSFDIPYLAKRMIVNGLRVPASLSFVGKKPWEINVEDTMEMWKGIGKDSVSLETLCLLLKIPNPKRHTNGSHLGEMVTNDQRPEVETYCQGDVEATRLVYQTLKLLI